MDLGLCAVCDRTGAPPILGFHAFFRGPHLLLSRVKYNDVANENTVDKNVIKNV